MDWTRQAAKGKALKDFQQGLAENPEVISLKEEVMALATRFPMPGFDVSTMPRKEL